jgi:hypothetical protein
MPMMRCYHPRQVELEHGPDCGPEEDNLVFFKLLTLQSREGLEERFLFLSFGNARRTVRFSLIIGSTESTSLSGLDPALVFPGVVTKL